MFKYKLSAESKENIILFLQSIEVEWFGILSPISFTTASSDSKSSDSNSSLICDSLICDSLDCVTSGTFVYIGEIPNEINTDGEIISWLSGYHFDLQISNEIEIPEYITEHNPTNPKHKFA